MQRAAGTCIASIALVLVAGACGGSSSSGSGSRPVKQWVTTFCTDAVAWTKSVTDAGNSVDARIAAAGSDVAGAKSALVGILDDSIKATDTVISQLDANGAPDAKNGKQIQDAVLSAFREGRTIYVDAKTRAENLPADPAAFVQQSQQLGTTITKGFESVGKAFSGIQKLDSDNTIGNEGKKNAACAQINKG